MTSAVRSETAAAALVDADDQYMDGIIDSVRKPVDSFHRQFSMQAHRSYSRERLLSRSGAYILIGLFALVVPAIGARGFELAAILMFVALPISVLVERYGSGRHVNFLHVAADVAFSAGLTLLVPSIWHAALVIASVAVAMTAMNHEATRLVRLTALLIAAFGFTG